MYSITKQRAHLQEYPFCTQYRKYMWPFIIEHLDENPTRVKRQSAQTGNLSADPWFQTQCTVH